MDGYLTTDEVAQRLSVKVETVRRWVRQGKLPGLPLGRAGYRIRQEDFNHFLRSQASQHSFSNSTAPSSSSNGMSESHIEAAATVMLERMTDGVLLFGLDGQCLYANQQVEQLLGIAQAALLGKTMAQVLPQSIIDMQKSIGQNDYFSTVTHRWYQLRTFAIPQGRCISFLDISERKQLEGQLQQSEEQFATLVEHLPDVVFRLDKHLRHLYISSAIESITGIAPEAFSGKTGREMGLLSEICDSFEAVCEKAMTTGEEQHMEFFHLGHWQRTRILPELALDGSVSSLMGVTEDITERVHAEQALHESRAEIERQRRLFETMLDNVSGLVFAWNRQHQFVYVNLAMEQLYGVEHGGAVGKTIVDLEYPPELLEILTPQLEHVFETGEVVRGAVPYTSPIGITGYFDYVWSPVYATDGTVELVVGMSHDTSERRRMEEVLRDAEKRVQAERQRLYDLFMQAPSAIMVTKGPQHVYELTNPLALQIMGTHRPIIGKSVREVLPEAEEQGFLDLLDAVYQTGKSFIGNEIPGQFDKTGDGTLTPGYFNFVYQPSYNAAKEIDGILSYVNDVTELVEARKRVEENEQRLRAMANNMPQLVWSANANGDIDFFNERMNEYAEIPDKNGIYEWQAIVYPEDREAIQRNWEQATKIGNAFEHELRLHMKDGTYRWHLTRGVPVHDTSGSISRWYGTKTDIEQIKQLEQQKNDFIGVVSHELKTPVTSAKAFAEVLENRFHRAGDEKSADLLAKMNAQMDKLTHLIHDLLDITRIEAGKLQFYEDFFAFDELIENIIEEVQRTTSHSIIKEGTTETTVYGDRERIGQVLTNLLTNAIKYSPNATTVVVTSSHVEQEVMLCVQDFGIGIDRDRLPHVFERFFRESGSREDTFPGLGLGLYVASEIISRQGGRIWAESEKGQGSTFCFTLPLQGSRYSRRHEDMFVEEDTSE